MARPAVRHYYNILWSDPHDHPARLAGAHHRRLEHAGRSARTRRACHPCVRAGDSTILLSLHRSRDTLDRLRRRPRVALTFLAEGNVAFTARGDARVIADPVPEADEHAAVRITVTAVDDHRQPAFSVLAGVARTWIDDGEKQALGAGVGVAPTQVAVQGLGLRGMATTAEVRQG
ncbi:hypothetical protein ACFU8W_37615 [Streptomyces sp. NPDC057565]|uniref:hypothetical protein n=1 Tax=Streptomyces sp. NPDC057565 TaxID=3346169 RepID=UPI00369935F9